jgi:putative Ca2+/H+ antiporter (TMEM165/GDT1 family)
MIRILVKGMDFVRKFLSNTDVHLFLSVLGVVLLSEMGDKTQLSTLLLAGQNPHYVFWVGLGSALALISTSFLEVIIGSQLIARFLKATTIRIISALAFLSLGLLLLTGIIGNIK